MRTLDKSRKSSNQANPDSDSLSSKSSNQENPDSDSCTPKLRFKDENGKDFHEWINRQLGELIEFRNGKGHEQNIDENGKYVVVNSKFVSTAGQVKKYCDTQIEPLHKGDIVMVMSDVPNGKTLAKCYLIEANNLYTLNQRICALKKKNSLNEFLIHIINRNEYYLSFDSGVGQTNLKKEDVLNCPLTIPDSLEEQQKIAAFLSAVDEKIQQLTRKKEALERYKKGVMQQLFSGKLRFKDENGKAFPKWEEKRLGDVFDFFRGSPFSKSDICDDGIYSCVHYGELFTTYKEVIAKIKSKTNLGNGFLSISGDILMPSSDVTPKGLAKASSIQINNVILGGDMNVLRPKIKYDSIFFSYLINFNQQKIIQIVTGTTVKHIYNKDVKLLKFKIPQSLLEQQKIASYLSGLDTKLERVSSQITEAQTFKKGLLQHMFV
jgi:type I restriction enzyme S subunit